MVLNFFAQSEKIQHFSNFLREFFANFPKFSGVRGALPPPRTPEAGPPTWNPRNFFLRTPLLGMNLSHWTYPLDLSYWKFKFGFIFVFTDCSSTWLRKNIYLFYNLAELKPHGDAWIRIIRDVLLIAISGHVCLLTYVHLVYAYILACSSIFCTSCAYSEHSIKTGAG